MESIKYCAVSSSMCSMPGWLPRSVFIFSISILCFMRSNQNSSLHKMRSFLVRCLLSIKLWYYISFQIFPRNALSDSQCAKLIANPLLCRTYKSESQMFAGKRRVIITRRPEWEMRRVIVPRGLRFWAVCLGSCYPRLFTANIQMSHKEESARAESLTLSASMVGSVSGSNLQIKGLQIN